MVVAVVVMVIVVGFVSCSGCCCIDSVDSLSVCVYLFVAVRITDCVVITVGGMCDWWY